MTQEEFDKAPLLDQILYNETGMLVKNHKDIVEAMEKYHQAKIKLLGIDYVSQQRELLRFKYKPIIEDLQQQLTDTNEKYAGGKLTEIKWLRHTAFLKGKISTLLNL